MFCTILKVAFQLFLQFTEARPTPDEQEVWEVVNTVLENSSKVLEDLRNYRGASDEIREVYILYCI